MFEQESAFIIYNHSIIDYSIGTKVNVEFDFSKIWDIQKEINNLKELYPHNDMFDDKWLGVKLIHIHPPGCDFYSELDRQVMKGFALSISGNVPFKFYIVTFNDQEDVKDTWHNCHGWYYDKVKKEIVEDKDLLPINKDHLYFLKFLSYNKFSEDTK